jgi:hypothetical protein
MVYGASLTMDRRTYGKVWGRSPGGLTVDIADEGLVDVASADEAVAEELGSDIQCSNSGRTSGRCMLAR